MREVETAVAALLLAAVGSPQGPAAWAQRPGDIASIAGRIDEVLQAYYEAGRFQGSALVAMHGNVIYRKSFGLANIEWGIPNTPETKYRIASLGKAFTAAVILQLVDEGRLDLQTPISTFLPGYRKDNGDRITVHHLLSHTSGIPGVPQAWIDSGYRDPYTLQQLVEQANLGELQFETGARFSYCNNGYNLLAAIIERQTGTPFEQVLRDRILHPLGMHDTGLVRGDVILERRASSYNRFLWGEFENAPYMDESFAVGAGGMYSTVDDLYTWDQALYGDELLSERSRERMFRPGLGNAGYGWGIGTYTKADGSRDNTLAYGYGGTSGAASVIFRLIDDRHLIVLLANIRQIPQGEIASNITNVLVGLPTNPISPPVGPLYLALVQEGVQPVLQAFGPDRVPSESLINQLGYQLLGRDRIDEAITVFEFNVAAYPEAWNTYDSLGEAYMTAGRREEAIRNYRKSLELNPDNESAKRMLGKLQAQ